MITGSLATLHTMPDTKHYNITEEYHDKKVINNTINNTVTNEKTVQEPIYNNIQPAYTDIDYKIEGNNLIVEDIDVCGQLYGSSMQPTIYTGYTICSTEYHSQELKEGMIIRYKRAEDAYTIHRVNGDYRKQGYIQTQGDNRFQPETVETSNITHIVKAVLHTRPEATQ